MNGSDPQQQWVAMQYPASAMMMAHHYPPHNFIAYHQQSHPQGSTDENKTIWVGDLHYWMDENYLHSCFAQTGENAKRDGPDRLGPEVRAAVVGGGGSSCPFRPSPPPRPHNDGHGGRHPNDGKGGGPCTII